MRRKRREFGQLALVVRAAVNAEKAGDVTAAVEAASPLPPVQIEVDEYGDRVRNGWVVGWWEQAGDTA